MRGTTGTQASFLELFQGDHAKVDRLETLVTQRMGFAASYGVTGQTPPRKVDAALAATLAGVAVSASKLGHDLRLLAHPPGGGGALRGGADRQLRDAVQA